jgi:hypothetical protein
VQVQELHHLKGTNSPLHQDQQPRGHLAEHGIPDNSTEPKFVRVEFTPPETGVADLSNWNFRVDQDIRPDWFDETEQRARIEEFTRHHVIGAQVFFEGRHEVNEGKFFAFEKSRLVARENSSVVARENSSVEAWGNSSVEARENSSVEAWGNSSVEAWGNSSVEAWGEQLRRGAGEQLRRGAGEQRYSDFPLLVRHPED